MTTTTMECAICLEDTRKYLDCGCSAVYCIPCAQQALLSTTAEPHCPNCRKGWTRQFLYDNFGNTFVNKTYRDHRRGSLLEIQKALLPDAMIQLAQRRDRARMENEAHILYERTIKNIKDLTIHVRDQKKKLLRMKKDFGKYEYPSPEFDALSHIFDAEQKLLEEIKHELEKQTELRDRLAQERRGMMFGNILQTPSTTETAEKSQLLLCSCPYPECRGFILRRNHTCGMCNKKICRDCREPLCAEHKCDPNTVKTVKLLKSDTKACPKCATLINKIDGCDQMWCPQCKVAFSWTKGTIENGYVHNPHYFEYMRRTGQHIARNPADIPREQIAGECRQPTMNTAFLILRYMSDYPRALLKGVHDKMIHINSNFNYLSENRRWYIGSLNRLTKDEPELRYKYLKNEITQEQFAEMLVRRDKLREKRTTIRDVLDIVINVAIDTICSVDNTTLSRLCRELYNFYQTQKQNAYIGHPEYTDIAQRYTSFVNAFIDKYVKQMYTVVDYANEQFIKIAENYSMKCPFIYGGTLATNNLLYSHKELVMMDEYNRKYDILPIHIKCIVENRFDELDPLPEKRRNT